MLSKVVTQRLFQTQWCVLQAMWEGRRSGVGGDWQIDKFRCSSSSERSPKLEKSSSKCGPYARALGVSFDAGPSTGEVGDGLVRQTFDGVGRGRECSEQQCRSGAFTPGVAQPGDWRKSAGDGYWMGVVDRPAALVGSIASFQGLARCWMRPRRRQRRQAVQV